MKTYGPLEVDPVSSGTCEPAGDPLLSKLGEMIRAILNCRVGDLWRSVWPAPQNNGTAGQVVHTQGLFFHNPNEVAFNTKSLPALYVFRVGWARPAYIALDLREQVSTIKAVWVFPLAVQEQRRRQLTIPNVIHKVLDDAIEDGCDPAWVDENDPDPKAPKRGSSMTERLGVWSLHMGEGRLKPVEIPVNGMPKPMGYMAFEMDILAEEMLVDSLSIGTGRADYAATKRTTTIGVQAGDEAVLPLISQQG